MTYLEVLKKDNEAHDGVYIRLESSGPNGKILEAHAELLPSYGRARIKFETADNIAAAMEAAVETILEEARQSYWIANPHGALRIDIDAGRFVSDLATIASRFGFVGPQLCGDFGTADEFMGFRGEFQNEAKLLPVAS